MTGTRVMKLWTAIVSAFVAVLAALGLAAPAAATTSAAAPRSNESCGDAAGQGAARPAPGLPQPDRVAPYRDALPPTMKQRIRAEAHGSSPSCRHSASGTGPLAGALTVAADAARYAAQHDTARRGTAARVPVEGAVESDTATAVVRR